LWLCLLDHSLCCLHAHRYLGGCSLLLPRKQLLLGKSLLRISLLLPGLHTSLRLLHYLRLCLLGLSLRESWYCRLYASRDGVYCSSTLLWSSRFAERGHRLLRGRCYWIAGGTLCLVIPRLSRGNLRLIKRYLLRDLSWWRHLLPWLHLCSGYLSLPCLHVLLF